MEGNNVVVLDTGSVFATSPGLQSQIKAEVALEAMKMMAYDIFNFGTTDFTFGVDFLLNNTSQFNVPTVNANVLYEDTAAHIIASSRIMQVNNITVGFIGIVSQSSASEILQSNSINSRRIMVSDEIMTLQTEINNIRNLVDIVIVLAYVGMAEAVTLADSLAGIDAIICGKGNQAEPLLTQNGVYIVQAGYQGKTVGKLVLRFDGNNNLYDAQGSIVSLSGFYYQDDIHVKALIDEYHALLETIKYELLNIPQVPPPSGGYYTGYTRCAICHAAQTNHWSGTSHASAFDALVELSQEYNSDCFACHTNGFGYTGGFVMSDTTPELEGVQCEMCHGAGGEHVSSHAPFGPVSDSICTQCHTPERSPSFSYPTYYPMVLHYHPPGDYDSDGVSDSSDNCPNAFNPNQEDVDDDGLGDPCDDCSDADGDGFGYPRFPGNTCLLDNCPDVTNADQTDFDNDGLGNACDSCPYDPYNDTDSDGICGDLDNCPVMTNSGQEDGDGDGLGDVCDQCTDTDGDTFGNPGFPNNTCFLDNCPMLANPEQVDSDGDCLGNLCDPFPEIYDPSQTDLDNDGFGDICDNCPYTYNNGQEDNDQDGIGDECDNCFYKPNRNQEDSYPPPYGNGVGDACECEADFLCDGDVDGSDAATFKANFGRSNLKNPCTNDAPCNGDFTCDHDVDGTDVAQFKSDFGRNGLNNPCPRCTQGEAWCVYPSP